MQRRNRHCVRAEQPRPGKRIVSGGKKHPPHLVKTRQAE
jgi:hypothetical protein